MNQMSPSAGLMLIAVQNWPASDKSVKTPASLVIPALQAKLVWWLTPFQADQWLACAQTDWLLDLMETVKLVYPWNLDWCETQCPRGPVLHSSFLRMSMSLNSQPLHVLVEAKLECYSDNDCAYSEVCHQGTCVDACLVTKCGANARCESRHHSAQCICLPGYTGNPQHACNPCEFSSQSKEV